MPPIKIESKKVWGTSAGELWVGDCVDVMRGLKSNSVDLIFADPPFNIGYNYDVYDDKLSNLEYLTWTGVWLLECMRLLKKTGSLYVSIHRNVQAELKVMACQLGFRWRDTVCWHYTFGPCQKSTWTPAWVPIHYFAKGTKCTWNADAVKVPSARQLKYKDRRAANGGKVPDNVWALLPAEEKKLFDPTSNCWLESRIAGTFKERTGHPCQMPLPVLERIVLASSNPGDLVLDPFVGSGTTAVAAAKTGRRYFGIDLSTDYLKGCCVPRLKELRRNMV